MPRQNRKYRGSYFDTDGTEARSRYLGLRLYELFFFKKVSCAGTIHIKRHCRCNLMEINMRLLFALSALLVVSAATPSMARDYPYCARTITNPDFGDCSFTSYRQCMATISGQGGDCIANPSMAYGQARGTRRRVNQDDGWQMGGWQNGWGRGESSRW